MSTNTKRRRSADEVPQHTNREARRQSAQKGKQSEYGKQKPIVKIGSFVIIGVIGIALVASMFPNMPIY